MLLIWALALFFTGFVFTMFVTEFYRWIPSILFWVGAATLAYHEYKSYRRMKTRHAMYERIKRG